MTILTLILATTGASLTLLSAVGLFRLPDPVSRLHAVTKASSVGTALMLTAVVVSLPHVDVALKAALAVVFQFMTAPVAAHVIGRASYRAGLLQNLVEDDMATPRHPEDVDRPT
ncbi:MAG: monovalent cation/H(+) antiporter subunit G [Nitriliruptorales bacterium]|nr:monovalent cation/H(+) antiporter subunit G [Nitriliruptorales bacterium]